MERISVRSLATAIRLIREPVVVTYSYPRNHPLYGAGEECGVFVPLALWHQMEVATGFAAPSAEDTVRSPFDKPGTKGIPGDYAESAE